MAIVAHSTPAGSFHTLHASIESRVDRKDPTMELTREQTVAVLLKETETAHGAYETSALGGEFDTEWPTWYAAYRLDHGLGDDLPGAENLDVANLAAMLAKLAEDYERGDQTSPWPDVYAQGIVARLRPIY